MSTTHDQSTYKSVNRLNNTILFRKIKITREQQKNVRVLIKNESVIHFSVI